MRVIRDHQQHRQAAETVERGTPPQPPHAAATRRTVGEDGGR
jgi:hypothetical protein